MYSRTTLPNHSQTGGLTILIEATRTPFRRHACANDVPNLCARPDGDLSVHGRVLEREIRDSETQVTHEVVVNSFAQTNATGTPNVLNKSRYEQALAVFLAAV